MVATLVTGHLSAQPANFVVVFPKALDVHEKFDLVLVPAPFGENDCVLSSDHQS